MKPIYIEILSSSDWHVQPNEPLPEKIKLWVAKAKEDTLLVGNGDLADLVIYGAKEYQNLFDEFSRELAGREFIYVQGNHDPESFIRELKLPDNIIVCKQFDWCWSFDNYWHFEHGYRLSYDWKFISRIAPFISDFMVDHFPKLWLRFSKMMGWVASKYINSQSKENKAYDKLIGTTHSNYIEDAEKKKINVDIGHTHKALEVHDWKGDYQIEVLDGGNLRDGSYCKITKDNGGTVEWL